MSRRRPGLLPASSNTPQMLRLRSVNGSKRWRIEHLPPIHVAPPGFRAVPGMLDRAGDAADIAGDMRRRAGLPLRDRAHVARLDAARQALLHLAGKRQRHVVIGRTERRGLDQPAEMLERAARRRPGVAGMGEAIRPRADRLLVHPLLAEAAVRLQVLVARPKIVAIGPGLHDVVLLQRVDGLGRPVGDDGTRCRRRSRRRISSPAAAGRCRC